jgi:hypothetical protein
MTIPLELQPLIAQAKQQHPQLAHLPDEIVAQLILEAMQKVDVRVRIEADW